MGTTSRRAVTCRRQPASRRRATEPALSTCGRRADSPIPPSLPARRPRSPDRRRRCPPPPSLSSSSSLLISGTGLGRTIASSVSSSKLSSPARVTRNLDHPRLILHLLLVLVRHEVQGGHCEEIAQGPGDGCGSVLAAREAARGRDALAMRFGRVGDLFVGGRYHLARRNDLARRDDDLFLRRLVLEVIRAFRGALSLILRVALERLTLAPDSFRRCSAWSSPSLAPGRLAALAVFIDEHGLVLGDLRLDRGHARHMVRPPLVVESTVPVPRRPLSLVLGRLILGPVSSGCVGSLGMVAKLTTAGIPGRGSSS